MFRPKPGFGSAVLGEATYREYCALAMRWKLSSPSPISLIHVCMPWDEIMFCLNSWTLDHVRVMCFVVVNMHVPIPLSIPHCSIRRICMPLYDSSPAWHAMRCFTSLTFIRPCYVRVVGKLYVIITYLVSWLSLSGRGPMFMLIKWLCTWISDYMLGLLWRKDGGSGIDWWY